MIAGSNGLAYAFGFSTMTAILHAVGLTLGSAPRKLDFALLRASRVLGVAMVGVGAWLLVLG